VYYAVALMVWRLSHDSVLAVRLLSTLCGLLTIWLTWRLGRELLPGASPLLPLAAAGMVAFLPMNLYLCSVVNNDALAGLVVTLGVYALARVLRNPVTVWRALGLGLLCGLAIMVKSTGVCLTAVVVIALLVQRAPWGRKLLAAGLALVGMLLVAGPWLGHNMARYGDPFAGTAIAFMSPAFSLIWLDRPVPGRLWRAFRMLYLGRSLWGGFDSLSGDNVFYPWWVYYACTGWLALALAGLARSGRAVWREPRRRACAAGCLAGIAVLMGGYVELNLVVFQAQGRYFFALLAPISLALCGGLARLNRWAPLAFVACLLAASVWGMTGSMV
jgi:4-amino-4-deoxy-L-arabinose transferase-like glycosyltransferase